MKDISTLVDDIYEVVKGNGGWDSTVTKFLSDGIAQMAEERFSKKQLARDWLSPSSLGMPDRKLWYKVNMPQKEEPLTAEELGTFFYGDLIEVMVIALAMAAGHRVEGLNDKVDVYGLPGNIDVIIDGWLVDVKSASKYGFEKFKKNALREDDPFCYIAQLSGYLYAMQSDVRVTQKKKAAFLVVQKDRFKLCLDVYDLSKEVENIPQTVDYKNNMVAGPMPGKCYDPEPEGKSGNMKLGVGCSYCGWKSECWPEMRTFIYSTGPKYLVKVVREPNVPEV